MIMELENVVGTHQINEEKSHNTNLNNTGNSTSNENNNMNINNGYEDEVFDGITPLVNITRTNNESFWSFGDEREWEREGGVSGSIAERRAATRGFNVRGFSNSTINIARFRSINNSPLSSPIVRSPYITIPAGISPTELLDSPVMLHRSQDLQLSNEFNGPTIKDTNNMELPFHLENPKSKIDNLDTQSYLEASNPIPLKEDGDNNSEGDQQGTYLSASGFARTTDDGYNWRKYGQKQVKGSEFPRSYYKCTYPKCQVKKKVERSHEGEVTEIIYKGTHIHPMPQPNPRLNVGSSFSENNGATQLSKDEGGGIVWRNIQFGINDNNNVNSKSENSDPSSNTKMKVSGGLELAGPLSGLVGSSVYDHNVPILNGACLDDEDDVDQSESKRRKTEFPVIETNVTSRCIREPKVVVQIESEVDILDDGYRWRKYGQKVVKGNPNPRSYYKCTSAGCPVRKHVERACDNIKYVITTYEGKHDHEVPVAKTGITNPGTNSSLTTSSTQPPYALSRINTNASKPERQVQDLALRLEKVPDLRTDFIRSPLFGNFGTEMYHMKFPPLQNPMSYGSLLLKPNGYAGMSEFPLSLLYGVPRPPSLVPSGVSIYNSIGQVQPLVGGQQSKENELGLLKPKQEKI